MIIGNLNYTQADDIYSGELATLTATARKVVFQPSGSKADKAPDYRVLTPGVAGEVELGAAWKKTRKEGGEYLSVKLDDPTLAQPINCAVVQATAGEGFLLVWSRDTRKKA